MLSIIFSIIALLMGVLTFIMFSQPLFWTYGGEGADLANKIWKKGSLYDAISFEEGQNTTIIFPSYACSSNCLWSICS